MKFDLRGKFGQKAQKSNEGQINYNLMQAFYRYGLEGADTIDHLRNQGARCDAEMLTIAIDRHSHPLVQTCLADGVRVTDEHICRAVDEKHAPIFSLLLEKTKISEDTKKYIERHGTQEMRRTIEEKATRPQAQDTPPPNTALLSVP